MYEYKITITSVRGHDHVYYRKSNHANFFTALRNDLRDIEELILNEDCEWYDWQRLENGKWI